MDINLFILFTLLSLTQSKELDCNTIKEFVECHNRMRSLVAQGHIPCQPASGNMRFMIWDDELADKAKKRAEMHTTAKNPDTKIASRRFEVGENTLSFVTSSNIAVDLCKTLDTWFKEYHDYIYGPLTESQFSGKTKIIGHYTQDFYLEKVTLGLTAEGFSGSFTRNITKDNGDTQIVWADTIYLGCGISEKYVSASYIHHYYVCYYGPAGNYIGRAPYDTFGAAMGQLICPPENCHEPYGKRCI